MAWFLTTPPRKCLIYGSKGIGRSLALVPRSNRITDRGGKGLKKSLAVVFALSLAGAAFAQNDAKSVRADRTDQTNGQADDQALSAGRHFAINPDGSNRQVLMVDEIDDLAAQNVAPRPIAADAFRIVPEALNLTYHGGD